MERSILLIYDQSGIQFPNRRKETQQKPNYDTAFVFVDDDWNNYEIKPVLQKAEI